MSIENDSRFRAATLATYLARYYPDARPHMIGRVVYEMQQAARAAVAWETKRCNVSMTEKQEDAGAARLAKLETGINALLADMPSDPATCLRDPDSGRRLRCTVELGGDPRGPCARLMIPGERGDGFGDGFAIF